MRPLFILLALAVPSTALLLFLAKDQTASPTAQQEERPTAVRRMPAQQATAAVAAVNQPQPPTHARASAKAESTAVPSAVEQFKAWTRSYLLGKPEAMTPVMVKQGSELAAQRRVQMEQLIQTDPKAALAAAVPVSTRKLLPPAILQHLEQPFSAKADLVVRAVTPRPGMKPANPYVRKVIIGERSLTAHVYGQRAAEDSLYNVPVAGIALGDHAAIAEDPVTVSSLAELPEGASLEPMIARGEHAGQQTPEADAVLVASASQYTPVCCAKHGQAVADALRAVDRQSRPFREALGGTANNSGTAPNYGSSTHTTGGKSLLVILADFSDRTGTPVDESTGSAMTASYMSNILNTEVSPFLNSISYGDTSISSVTVTSLLRVTGTLSSYAKADNVEGIKAAAIARAKAVNAAHNADNFDRVMLVFADTSQIIDTWWTWAGLADLGGKFIWMNGWFTPETNAHEILHTYGMRHANLWLPPDGSPNPVDTNGTFEEYGDLYDVMGAIPFDSTVSQAFPNPASLARVGWLPSTAVQSVSTSGTYRLYSYDNSSATLTNSLSLYLDRDGVRQYWLAYRKAYAGHPSLSAAGQGATLAWGYRNNVGTNLIDTSIASAADDAAIGVGNIFSDPAAGLTFNVTAAGGSAPNEYIDVQVTVNPRVVVESAELTVDEKAGAAVVKVFRRGSSSGAISVDYTTVPGDATTADYTQVAGTLSWASGNSDVKTITVPLTADATTELPEDFSVLFQNPTGCVLSHGSIAHIIVNDPGAHDETFTHEDLYASVYDMVLQPDGKAIVAGMFGAYGTVFSDGLVRFNNDGTVDSSFEKGAGANILPVTALARQPDDKILVGGKFTSIRGAARNFIARLNADGTLDTSFDPGTGPNVPVAASNGINCITVQPDGKILVGGEFTTWSGTTRKCLARLNVNGLLDSSFPNLDDFVDVFSSGNANGVRSIAIYPIATAPHFSVLVGGGFSEASGSPGFRSGVIRFNADGAEDTSFVVPYGAHAAGANNSLRIVSSLAVQPDGKILVGGQFTGFNNVSVNRIARLLPNGNNDTSFITNVGTGLTGSIGEVSRFVVQPDGNITVSGFFTAASGATGLKGLTRYLGTGSRDTTFVTRYTDATAVTPAVLQPDNQLLVGFWDAMDTNRFLMLVTSGISGGKAGVIEFATATTNSNEGASATITVNRVGGSKGAISVNYHSRSGTAIEGTDYTASTGTLTWADGDAAPKTFTVTASTDSDVEAPETVFIALSNPLGGTSLGNLSQHTLNIEDAPANQPLIGFATATSTSAENSGSQLITVQLTGSPAAGPVSANIDLTGTASNGVDYSLGSATVTITPPSTSAQVTVSLIDDAVVESAETVTLTLSGATGGLINNPAANHTLSITDNETAPGISDPGSQTVVVGSNVTLSVVASGSPTPTLQWYKNNVLIPGQTNSSLPLNAVQLATAGSYHCVATSGSFVDPSAPAELVVVDNSPSARVLNLGGTTTLSISAAGNGISYQWVHNGAPITSDIRHLNATGSILTIKSIVAGDAGNYWCRVTGPGGLADGGLNALNLISLPPLITPPVPLPPAIIGGPYNPDGGADGLPIAFDSTTARTPATWTQTGLPTGLRINATTGVISGRPTVRKTTAYAVTITAANATGKHTVATSIMVGPLATGTVGSYLGRIDRDNAFNANLGGRITLTTTATATFTGSLVLGGKTYAITGTLQSASGSTISNGIGIAKRTGSPTLNLSFVLDAATGRITLGNISDGPANLGFTAWRKQPIGLGSQGYYTGHLTPPISPYNAQDIPQGISYAAFTVKADGSVTVSGRLADATAYTTAGHISDAGDVLVFQSLYTNTGSVTGLMKVLPGVLVPNTDSVLATTSLTWSRSPQASATARSYRSGFDPFPLTVTGARYVAPPTIGPVAMGLANAINNAEITFTPFDTDLTVPLPDLITQVLTTGRSLKPASTSNIRGTTLTVTNTTGIFTGTFRLVDPNPVDPFFNVTRTPVGNAYFGIIVTHPITGNVAQGYFALPIRPPPPSSPAPPSPPSTQAG